MTAMTVASPAAAAAFEAGRGGDGGAGADEGGGGREGQERPQEGEGAHTGCFRREPPFSCYVASGGSGSGRSRRRTVTWRLPSG